MPARTRLDCVRRASVRHAPHAHAANPLSGPAIPPWATAADAVAACAGALLTPDTVAPAAPVDAPVAPAVAPHPLPECGAAAAALQQAAQATAAAPSLLPGACGGRTAGPQSRPSSSWCWCWCWCTPAHSMPGAAAVAPGACGGKLPAGATGNAGSGSGSGRGRRRPPPTTAPMLPPTDRPPAARCQSRQRRRAWVAAGNR